jgi:hypothetical protein
LAKLCESCGAANDADESFCGQCGAALGEIGAVRAQATATMPATVPPSADPQRSAERRHVSVAAAQGRDADVATHARNAVDLFDKMQMPFWKAVSRLEHGEWLTSQGRAAEAEELLGLAAATFSELGAAPWLQRVAGARVGRDVQPEAAAAMPA